MQDALPVDGRNDTSTGSCVRRVDGVGTLDLFVAAGPAFTRADDRGQFVSMASRALDTLSAHGLGPSNVVCGFIHLAKTPSWAWREALASAWNVSGPLPITALLQPPAAPFCFCTLQLHAIRSARQSGVWHGHSVGPAAATVLRSGARHLRLMSITPRPELLESASMTDLTYDMLAQAGHALTARGLRFRDVVRTWIYVQDIERNYGAVNQARNRYFSEQGLARLPASTGVEGALPGAFTPVAMDLYAVVAGGEVRVEAAPPGLMGQASVYGSAFARGSLISEPDRRTLYVSGTASIDADGRVVAVGDIQGQLDCMFGNVRALLDGAGMEFGHAVGVTAYLKRAGYYRAFVKAAAKVGLPADVPASVVVAEICRPEWLCEIEVCAVRKSSAD
jgi:enamine deaminase RidA (YjgF/YER057c/UK114 family)